MTYIPAQRNYDRIQFEKIRRKVDPKYTQLHDRLSEAYYTYKRENKDTSVTIGNGNKTIEFTTSKTPEENKQLFDKYHALIEYLRQIALDTENKKQSKPDIKLYNQYNTVPEGRTKKTRLEELQERVAKLKNEGIDLEV